MTNTKTCSVDGCDSAVRARSLCNKHWQRWSKYGDPKVKKGPPPLPEQCEVNGCETKPVARFQGRAVCNPHWQRLYRYGREDRLEREPTQWGVCSLPECDKPSRSPSSGMCEMHYMRQRRRGTTERKVAQWRERSHGYVAISGASHPLSGVGGQLYQHRAVLFDAIGWGPHSCHWCGKVVEWRPGHKTASGSLVVDHLDDDKSNNAISNLVASCHGCNATRGRASLCQQAVG